MTPVRPADLVDAERLWRRLMRLAEFGATANGGVNRQALSGEEIAARSKLCSWARDVGLETFNDSIGNLFVRLEGQDAGRHRCFRDRTSTPSPRAASSTEPSVFWPLSRCSSHLHRRA